MNACKNKTIKWYNQDLNGFWLLNEEIYLNTINDDSTFEMLLKD